MIDEMARLGVPPGNPFQGGATHAARLLLSVAFLRRRTGARERDQRLGSRCRADGFHRLFVGHADDGACGLAERPRNRRLSRSVACIRRILAARARVSDRQDRALFVRLAAERIGGLVLSGHLGAAAHRVGDQRRHRDHSARRTCPQTGRAASADICPDCRRGLRELDLGRRNHICIRGRGRGRCAADPDAAIRSRPRFTIWCIAGAGSGACPRGTIPDRPI